MADAETLFPTPDPHQLGLRAMGEIERLPGVLAAALWLDPQGQLLDARIHVMPGAAPSIIANATSHVLQALRIDFDPRVIRTVNVALADDLNAIARPSSDRLLLLRDIALHTAGNRVTCNVQLASADRTASGEARELDSATGRIRAAALATLHAAEALVTDLALGLEAAALPQLFGRTYAVVSIEASISRRSATLAGLVPVDAGRAPEEAVCMAVLRAIDRWATPAAEDDR